MNNQYQIADITPACIHEINVLQDKLSEQSHEDIILVAYEMVSEEQ